MKDTEPLYIHANFRSGSTLVWSLLERAGYRSYFEPLHERFATIGKNDVEAVSSAIMGTLDSAAPKNIFGNYLALNRQIAGLRGYHPSFAVERYFLNPEDLHAPLQAYIDFLLADAKTSGKTAAFKFVRSQGRVGWFKRHFEGKHIAIIRRPFEQFSSFVWNAHRGNYYFLGFLLHIVKTNLFCGLPHFGSFVSADPIRSDHFYLAQEACEGSARHLNLYQLYFLFYYVWKRCALQVMRHCDAVIDINDYTSLTQLSQILGFEIERDRIVDAASLNEIAFNSRFARVEALARYCLLHDGHYYPPALAAESFVPMTLLPELEADRRAVSGDPLGPFSEGETFNAIGEKIRLEEEDKNARRRRNIGVAGLRSLAYNQGQAVVTVDSEGEHSDFAANTAVVGDGAQLVYNPERDEECIRFDFWKEAMIFAGHHPRLGEGHYRLILDIESAPRIDSEPNVYSRLAIDIVSSDGVRVLLPMSSFPNHARRFVSFQFALTAVCYGLDIRLWAFRSAGRAYGYRLTALGGLPEATSPGLADAPLSLK